MTPTVLMMAGAPSSLGGQRVCVRHKATRHGLKCTGFGYYAGGSGMRPESTATRRQKMAKHPRRRGLRGFVKPAKTEKKLMYVAGFGGGLGLAFAADRFIPAAVPNWVVSLLAPILGVGAYVLGYRKLGLGVAAGGGAYLAKDTVLGLLPEGAAAATAPPATPPAVQGYVSDNYRNAQIGAYLAQVMRGNNVVSPGVRINGPGTYGNPAPQMELAGVFNGPFGYTFAPRM